MVSSPGVELGRPEQSHVGLVGTTGGADVEVTAATTARPNLPIFTTKGSSSKWLAFAFPRHYYGPVGLLHLQFGNHKGDARVPLDFPFFSPLVPTDH